MIEMKTPSLRRRMACWLYEGMLLFGVVFIAGYLFSSLSQTRHAMDNRPGLQAFVCLVFAIYAQNCFPIMKLAYLLSNLLLTLE